MVQVLRRSKRPFGVFLAGAALVALLSLGGSRDARSDDDEYDVIVLNDGSKVEGTIVETREGAFWIVLVDGRMTSVPLEDVLRVDFADKDRDDDDRDRDRDDDYDDDDDDDERGGDPYDRVGGGGGFEFGTFMGGRIRFYIPGSAMANIDIRTGVGLGLDASGSPYPILVSGPEFAFFDAPVHLVLSMAGGIVLYSSPYPVVLGGIGGRLDAPNSPFEFQWGLRAGLIGSSFGFQPDLTVGFVW
jgi:hypothetical protein